jgi:hypothetical protein
MTQGVIVNLHVRKWSAKKSLKPEDLGLRFFDEDAAQAIRKYIVLGSQRLLPDGVYKDIKGVYMRLLNNLYDYSFDTPWGRFVPNTAFDAWKRDHEQLKNEFNRLILSLSERYNEILALLKEEYVPMARDVWHRLYPEGKSGPTLSFIDSFTSNVIKKVPSREEIASKYSVNVTYSMISMPSVLENDIAEAKKIKFKSEMEKYRLELEKKTKERLANEYVESRKQLIDSFLQATVIDMRKYISELCDSVLESIGKSRTVDRVKSQHINKLKKMIKKVHMLNFQNDQEISKLLNDLETEMDKFKGERSDDIIVEKLKQISTIGSQEFMPSDFNPAISYLEAGDV